MKKKMTMAVVLAAVIIPVGSLARAEVSTQAAIAKGAKFLVSQQNAAGFFSDRQMPALTALPLWALTGFAGDAELPAEKLAAVRAKAARYVLSTQRDDGGFYVPKPGRGGSGLGNYNTSVCLSALFEAKLAPAAALLKAREYIASSQLVGDDTLAGGFGYDKVSRRRYADLSNTGYALDAMRRTESLEEQRGGGRRVDVDWQKAIAFVENLQKKEGPDRGGAAYNERTPQAGTATNAEGRVQLRAYGSMSYAAVLAMCSAKLTRADPRVKNALEYCSKYWTLDENPGMGNQGLYYYYDILARALAAANLDEIDGPAGKIRWKEEIAKKLVSLQRADGSWANDNNRFWESDPVLCTSFAMIVLELAER